MGIEPVSETIGTVLGESESTVKLYYSPGLSSLSPHIVAREAGFELQLIKVDLATHITEQGQDYYEINHRGYVPLLELDDGTRLREGAAIVQFLADKAPDSGLAPAAGTLERVRLQEWLTYIGMELHRQFFWLFRAPPEEIQRTHREKIARRLAELDGHLASNPCLLGQTFTVADAYAFSVVSWCNRVKIDLQPYPHLVTYLRRIADRPKVQEALKAEGL